MIKKDIFSEFSNIFKYIYIYFSQNELFFFFTKSKSIFKSVVMTIF